MKNTAAIKYPLFLTLALSTVSFQNCSKTSFKTAENLPAIQPSVAVVTTTTAAQFDEPSTTPPEAPLTSPTPATTPQIDALSCARDYITLFDWQNTSVLAQDAFASFTPELSPTKIKTIKIFNLAHPVTPPGVGWALSSFIHPTADGHTSTVVYIEKVTPVDSDHFDCYFSPQSNVATFFNIGLDNTPRNLEGYLSNSTKYMACRISSGQPSVRILSADGISFDLPANRPFVLKRGCYQ